MSALKTGITPFDFWDYTIAEVTDIINVYYEKQKEEMKFSALCSYNNALLIVSGINNMFSKKQKQQPQIWEVFKGLFEQPKNINQASKEDVMKARLMAYSQAWKKQNGKE